MRIIWLNEVCVQHPWSINKGHFHSLLQLLTCESPGSSEVPGPHGSVLTHYCHLHSSAALVCVTDQGPRDQNQGQGCTSWCFPVEAQNRTSRTECQGEGAGADGRREKWHMAILATDSWQAVKIHVLLGMLDFSGWASQTYYLWVNHGWSLKVGIYLRDSINSCFPVGQTPTHGKFAAWLLSPAKVHGFSHDQWWCGSSFLSSCGTALADWVTGDLERERIRTPKAQTG